MNRVTYQVKNLELNDFGAYHGEFKVPRRGGPSDGISLS